MAFLPAELRPPSGRRQPRGFSLADLVSGGRPPDLSPGSGAQTPFAVAIKGGNNGVSHGHEDAGSFSLVVGTNLVICDPGGEVYTARTFSAHRFDSQVLNSFGHAVPVVAGHLQKSGPAARAEVRETGFAEAADTLTFDLRPAYPVPVLKQLDRTFIYERSPRPALTVRDTVKFSRPESYETALITWGTVRADGPDALIITDGESSVRVTIDTRGQAFHWHQKLIDEDVSSGCKPFHIGIRLDQKLTTGVITLHISPVPSPAG